MKVAIIGAGAMGSLFGAYLAEGGNDVVLVDVWREHVQAINETGLTIEESNGEKRVKLPAVTDPRSLQPRDLVIIFVKSHHTAAAVKNARNLFNEQTLVLTLQNGVGNAETIAGVVGDVPVIAGTTSHGGTVLGPGRIRHAGTGETIIGMYNGENNRLINEISAEFTRCRLQTGVSDNIEGLVWGKLLVNAGINPLTTICKIPNGALVEIDQAGKLMEMVVSECEAVARAKGVELPYPSALEKVKEVARATGANQSSMLQDIKKGRPTEIDFINGIIVKEGRKAGIPTPCNEVVTLLVKTLEEKEKSIVKSSQ